MESQVRQWAADYPADLRNKWGWCWLDSAADWSTDQKLREDVRLKSVQVLTDTERQTLTPLDDQIKAEIPKQKTPLQETYQAVGQGLQTAAWSPPPEVPLNHPFHRRIDGGYLEDEKSRPRIVNAMREPRQVICIITCRLGIIVFSHCEKASGNLPSCPLSLWERARVRVHDLSLVLPLTLPVSEKTSPEGRGDVVYTSPFGRGDVKNRQPTINNY